MADITLAQFYQAVANAAREATLEVLKDSDGIKKIADAVDVSDKAERVLGQVTVTGSLPAFASTPDVSVVSRPQKQVVLANAVEVRSTSNQNFDLITHGGLTADEIRQYREFRISVMHTHDQDADVTVMDWSPAINNFVIVYSDKDVAAGSNSMLYGAQAAGTGVGTSYKQLALLRQARSNVRVRVRYPVAPSSGALTIVVEMN